MIYFLNEKTTILMWWLIKGFFPRKYSGNVKNVSNPISFYEHYISKDFVGNVCNKCKCLLPIHGQIGHNLLFDKGMLEKSKFEFKPNKSLLSIFRSKEREEKRKEHKKVFPKELTGYFYTVYCRKCKYKYQIKEEIVEDDYYYDGVGE